MIKASEKLKELLSIVPNGSERKIKFLFQIPLSIVIPIVIFVFHCFLAIDYNKFVVKLIIPDNWVNIGMFLISLIALVVTIWQYFAVMADKRRTAATIIYSQLKQFDDIVIGLKEIIDKPDEEYRLFEYGDAKFENYWSKSNMLLIKNLNEEDINLIEKAYQIMQIINHSLAIFIRNFHQL